MKHYLLIEYRDVYDTVAVLYTNHKSDNNSLVNVNEQQKQIEKATDSPRDSFKNQRSTMGKKILWKWLQMMYTRKQTKLHEMKNFCIFV